MSEPTIPEEAESHNMHHRVARLSITVEDDSHSERQQFLSSIKTPSEDSIVEKDEEKENKCTESPTRNEVSIEEKKRLKKEKMKLKKQRKRQERQAAALGNSTTNNNTNSDEDHENSAIADDLVDDESRPLTKNQRIAKRRRSSVTQNVIVRKKKFLSEDPRLVVLSDMTKKASISSIRDLLLYSLTDMDLDPRWCNLTNRRSVDKFVIVFLRGLTNEEFGMPSLKDENDPKLISNFPLDPRLTDLGKYFKEVIPMIAPGSKKCIFSTYSSLVSYSLSNKQKAAIKKENDNRKIVLPDLYLTLEEMLFNNYPIHKDVPGATEELVNQTADFKSTNNFYHDGSRTFALDCEMCRSATGRVLARVSLTDFENNVLVDKLIKPTEPIVDYLTQWSGITEEQLIGVETTLEQIQDELLSIVSSNDTLIGHSLESDLTVLKIKHPNIVDTSVCFDHPRGPPAKASLKMLMSTHLDTAIQKSFSGHDSVEDCISCMELVKLKIAKGYLFGKSYNMESLFKRIAQNNKLIKTASGEKIPKKSVVIGYSTVKNFGHHELQIQCQSDDEIIDKFVECQNDNDLIVMKLRELEWFKEFADPSVIENLKLPQTKEEMLSKVNERIGRIYENLAPNSILVICSENGDTREMLRLQSLMKTFKYKVEKGADDKVVHVEDASWTEDAADRLAGAIDTARDALFLCTLKPKATATVPLAQVPT